MPNDDTQPNDGPADRTDVTDLQVTSVDAKVIGELSGTDGAGVYGRNRTESGDSASLPSGLSLGLYGTTDKSGTTNGEPNAVGVFGNTVATSGRAVGVVGRTESPDGIGVVGNSIDASGLAMFASGDATVDGLLTSTEIDASTTDLPVRGHATDSGDPTTLPADLSTGVYGVTDQSEGLKVASTGVASDNVPNTTGVYGNSVAASGRTVGVAGRAESPSGVGVYGETVATSGYPAGVIGRTASPNGVAVFGDDANGDGLAMFAGGDLRVDGQVDVRDVGVEAALSSDLPTSNGTVTPVTFDAVKRDDFGAYDPMTGTFTVPAAGDYRVEVGLSWSQSFSNDRIIHYIDINGSLDGGLKIAFDGSGKVARTHSRTMFDLAKGDTLTVTVEQNSGGGKDLVGSQQHAETFLSVEKIG